MPTAPSPYAIRATHRRGLLAVAAVTPALLFTGIGTAAATTPVQAAAADTGSYDTRLECEEDYDCSDDRGKGFLFVVEDDDDYQACLKTQGIRDVRRLELFREPKGNRVYIFKVRGHDRGPVTKCVDIPKRDAEELVKNHDKYVLKVRAKDGRYEGDDL